MVMDGDGDGDGEESRPDFLVTVGITNQARRAIGVN